MPKQPTLLLMKKIIIICVLLVRTATLCAQQTEYNWRLGLSGGFTNYYGDLSPMRIHALGDAGNATQLFEFNSHYVERPSYRITIERRLSNTIGLMLSAGSYQFAGSDRYINRSGELKTNTPEFGRALNFNTTLQDVGLSLVFKTDNDKLFSKTAFFAPYFTLGAGWFSYDISGDLRDDNGNFYDYSTGTPALNGNYETNLSQIQTNENNYLTEGWYTNLGLGLKFRLSRRLDLNIETIVHFTNTDYLDDVSGNYPATFENPEQAFASQPAAPGSGNLRGTTNHNDLYIYHGVTLKYSFGYREKSFNAPTVRNYGIGEYTMEDGIYSIKSDSAEKTAADSTTRQKQNDLPHTTLNVFNYAAIIQEDDTPFKQQTNEHLFELRRLLEISELQSQHRENDKKVSALQEELNVLDEQISEWTADTLSPADERRKMLKKLGSDRKEKEKLLAEKQASLDSLNTSIADIRTRPVPIDSNSGSGTKIIIGADTQTYYLPGNLRPVKKTARDTVFLGSRDTTGKQISHIQEFNRTSETQTESLKTASDEIQKDDQITELQKQIDELREMLQAKEREKQPKRETPQAATKKDEDIQELRIEIAELRAAFNEREKSVPEKALTPEATPAPITDLRAVNANLAAQTAAITALSYALLRDQKTTDEEKNQIQSALMALDTVSQNQDSVYILLDSLAKQREIETQPAPEQKTPGKDAWISHEQKAGVNDSALKELELRINRLSNQIEEKQSLPAQAQQDTIGADINQLIARIEELNKKLDAERAAAQNVKEDFKTLELNTAAIYFDLNSSTLSATDEKLITSFVEQWNENKTAIFELIAYADNTGSVSYNINMCEKRLQTVKRSILSRFKTGSKKPQINLIIGGTVVRSSQNTPKAEDRRVEIILKKHGR